MKQVRHNVFETNSSSTHSICIATNTKLDLPDKLDFNFGEFGWEVRTLDDIEEKASYLYTGLYNTERHDDIKNIVSVLESKGIAVFCEKPKKDGRNYFETGYVDHSYELTPFLDAICSNEETLLQFLFSQLSFILTANDNDDYDVDIDVNYEHIEFYKGN